MSVESSDMHRLVSSSCDSVVSKTSQLFSSLHSQHKPPLLMFPPDDTTYNPPADLMLREECATTYMYYEEDDPKTRCIGSSKGWMVLRQGYDNGEYCLFLFNPLYRKARKIVFPDKFPPCFTITDIKKAIPTMHTFQPGYQFGVVFKYGIHEDMVALLLIHDEDDQENKWIDLGFSDMHYDDVLFYKGYLFALSTLRSIVVWDLTSISCSGLDNKTHYKTLGPQFDHVPELDDEKYTQKFYLVKSQDGLFLVLRCIGEFVKGDGEVIMEGDLLLLGDECCSHLDAPYKTKSLYVFKLDLEERRWERRWERVESIGDQVIFLGLNQSLSLKASDYQECKTNSIYFTDDYWEHIDTLENDLYGGHDIGIFSLSDRSVTEIVELKRMVPPPVWVEQNICGF